MATINLVNTAAGFVPAMDEDFEVKRRLKLGEVYKVSIKKARNYEFHKKYFALINCSWEYLNAKQQAFFKDNVEVYRKTMEVSAGHCEVVYNLNTKQWVDIPKSIAFDKIDNVEFQDLYDRVKHVIFSAVLKNISIEEFERQLANF